ncbi:hypothetical protein BC6307_04820 [Sutcliffiella cohnii]|uniref:Glycosyltransferase 2-like domain-containing protein n=1 Tax=Sutcliffiella cohnii TaxID=33932 RepID=A0A223KME2_9BACI|nr:glycosyltransferase family A protein [Sutcliffiella cohnii]AST90651.1 hypothetical protein BC6307_04820 [Sutcliffiella cohnii]
MISIICCTNRSVNMENIFQNYKRQQSPGKMELIIVLNRNSLVVGEYKRKANQHDDVTIVQLDEQLTLGECLNKAVKFAKYDYIAKFDDDDYYGPNYIQEALEALKGQNVPLVGKSSIYIFFEGKRELRLYNSGKENTAVSSISERTNFLAGSTFVMEKELLSKVPFRHLNVGEDYYFQYDILNQHYTLYSTSANNYVYCRSKDKNNHTSTVNDSDLYKRSIPIYKGLDCLSYLNIL